MRQVYIPIVDVSSNPPALSLLLVLEVFVYFAFVSQFVVTSCVLHVLTVCVHASVAATMLPSQTIERTNHEMKL